jgi:hypothetical protein
MNTHGSTLYIFTCKVDVYSYVKTQAPVIDLRIESSCDEEILRYLLYEGLLMPISII